MRVADVIVKARRTQLAQLLAEHQYLSLAEVCARLDISEATARRDLAWLEQERTITRTYGGAIGDYNRRFDSFRQRSQQATDAKQRIARAALAFFEPRMTVYLDGGTTVYGLAELLLNQGPRPLTIVTNNIMVAEHLSDVPDLEINVLGGQYLRRQALILGENADKSARMWHYDLAIFGAEGMTTDGVWNTQKNVVAVEQAVADMAKQTIFLVDQRKLGVTAPAFLLPWTAVHTLITDSTAAQLTDTNITLRAGTLVSCP